VGVLTGQALIRYLSSHGTTLDRWLLPAEENAGAATRRGGGASVPLLLVARLPAF
jgi:hypothetical protein